MENIFFYKRYLKYKSKYINLKNKIGGSFKIIGYLGSGAENMAFDIGNNRILRVRKNCEDLGAEIEILNIIKQVNPKYFVKIYDIGKCTDLKTKFDNIKSIKEICNNVSGDICNYHYVIMENANGINIIEYIIKYLNKNFNNINNELINLDDNDIKILLNDLIIYILQIFEKICDGLIDAQIKIPNFYHGDLNYRNVFINESTNEPIIFDFGASKIIRNEQPLDILNYIKDTNNNISDFISKNSDMFKNNIKNIVEYIINKYNFLDLYEKRKNSQNYTFLDINVDVKFTNPYNFIKEKLIKNQCSILKEILIIKNLLAA